MKMLQSVLCTTLYWTQNDWMSATEKELYFGACLIKAINDAAENARWRLIGWKMFKVLTIHCIAAFRHQMTERQPFHDQRL